jgi:hypothetical protein
MIGDDIGNRSLLNGGEAEDFIQAWMVYKKGYPRTFYSLGTPSSLFKTLS